MDYRFITIAGMDYEIDEEDYEPDTLLALNNFEVSEEDLKDEEYIRDKFLHQLVILGLKRFMDIGEYVFKKDSVFSVSEALKENDTYESEMIEFDKEPILVGEDIDHAEKKRMIIPITTKIRISFKKQPLSEGYRLSVEQWTNDNDEDQEWQWIPLFWITAVSN